MTLTNKNKNTLAQNLAYLNNLINAVEALSEGKSRTAVSKEYNIDMQVLKDFNFEKADISEKVKEIIRRQVICEPKNEKIIKTSYTRQPDEDISDELIELDLTVRTYNTCYKAGLTNVNQFKDLNEKQIKTLKSRLGQKATKELNVKLLEKGITALN